MDESEPTADILEQFKTESRENLERAEAALLSLENAFEANEAINELFRAVHTIKGSADYLGLKDLKVLSHAFENILDQRRKMVPVSISKAQSDVFFDVLDVINKLVAEAPEISDLLAIDCKQLIEELEKFNTTEDFGKSDEVLVKIESKAIKVFRDTLIALREFRESYSRLTHITGELQRSVIEMRMIPIKTLFERYPRIARDVCRKNGKSVDIVFDGEDTEIDKGIADQISEPLIHLVRNAIDHGIESPLERKKLGKSESGTLTLKAFHHGNSMVIEITDNGGGINLERIKSKVIEKGWLTLDQASQCSNSELLNYIFVPGFSTAASITDISGRGVGLDVVKTNLGKIKGNVSVTTEVNQGTCFRLEVPLTVAIMRALLVKANHAIYAISLQDVCETVKIRASELQSIRQKTAITLRGEVIMVEWLSQLLGNNLIQITSEELRLSILILQVNGHKFGLIVDSVFKQEEIVVKPLPESYTDVQGVAGASILGDGKAILILDSNQLYGCMSEAGQLTEEVLAERSPLVG